MYNKAAPMKPQSWQDLVSPAAKGQVVLPSPLYSGAAAIHMGALSDDPALGEGYYASLAKNQPGPSSPSCCRSRGRSWR
jgi:iron(III) transport system substrate-binding protein